MIRSCNTLLPFTCLFHFGYMVAFSAVWWHVVLTMVKNNRQPAIWVGLGPEFHVNSGSGPVGSLHLWVGLSRVKKIGPTSNCDTKTSATSIARRITSLLTSSAQVSYCSTSRRVSDILADSSFVISPRLPLRGCCPRLFTSKLDRPSALRLSLELCAHTFECIS